MKSLKELYRLGLGPSSSHTMGPRFAAQSFLRNLPDTAKGIRITLYGSLAATGRGHLTDIAVSEPFAPMPTQICLAVRTFASLASERHALRGA
jgi:L-serine dehydratase